MPRCSTHCPPPRSSGALLLAVIVAGVVIIAAGKTAVAHTLTTLAIAAGIIAGLTIAGLTTAAVMHLRLKSRARRQAAPSGRPQRLSMRSPPAMVGRRSAARMTADPAATGYPRPNSTSICTCTT